MNITNAGKKLFVRDFNLPITVLKDPYWEYFLDLYQPLFNSRELWNLFTETVNSCGNEGLFMKELRELKAKIISTLTHTEAYIKFEQQEKERKKQIDYGRFKFSKKSRVYNSLYNGKCFLSIDLVKANFQTLRRASPELVLNTSNYKELILKFTKKEYFIRSKSIRQYMFGKMNPKSQLILEKELMQKLLQSILIEKVFEEKDLICLLHDEVIFILPEDISKIKEIEETLRRILQKHIPGIQCHFEFFRIHSINSEKRNGKLYGFVKEDLNEEKISFKCVEKQNMAQVYKFWMKQECCENDLLFTYNDEVARMMESCF